MSIDSNLSIFDMLSMVLPGGVLLWAICSLPCDALLEWNCVQVILENKDVLSPSICLGVMAFIFSFVLGLMNFTFTNWCWNKCKLPNNPETIMSIKETYCKDGRYSELAELFDGVKKEKVKEKYYTAYTYNEYNNSRCAFHIVENQVAMFRSLLIPIMLLAISSFIGKCWIMGILLIILDFFVFWVTKIRMRKVIELVFEEYEALKEVQEKTPRNCNE